VNGELITEW